MADQDAPHSQTAQSATRPLAPVGGDAVVIQGVGRHPGSSPPAFYLNPDLGEVWLGGGGFIALFGMALFFIRTKTGRGHFIPEAVAVLSAGLLAVVIGILIIVNRPC